VLSLLHPTTQRATKGFSAQTGPPFRYLIRRNPPMSLRVAYRRILGLIAEGLFKIPPKSAVWLTNVPTSSQSRRSLSSWSAPPTSRAFQNSREQSRTVGLARGLFVSRHAGCVVQICQLWGEKGPRQEDPAPGQRLPNVISDNNICPDEKA
jgi:hypothetical protein